MSGVWRLLPLLLVAFAPARVDGQSIRYGSPVRAEVKNLYQRGLAFLSQKQGSDGSWGRDAGVTAICLMALVASGEDPNFGRHADAVRAATRFIIRQQEPSTGFIKNGMYQHGFATLALADVYGAIDDEMLWQGQAKLRSIGEALELAVRCSVTSQEQNPFGAWRYSARAQDADTSVAGAIFMGLLAARNAGIEVPDRAIERAIQYFVSMTSTSGTVAYSGIGGFGDSLNRSSIAALVCAIAKRKDLETYKATLEYLRDRAEYESSSHPYYFRYYMSQALFQGDHEVWMRWTQANTLRLTALQNGDGSLGSGGRMGGHSYSTGMLLLSAALDYCFLPIYER